MKLHTFKAKYLTAKAILFTITLTGTQLITGCSNQNNDYLPVYTKATSIIQVNLDDQLYSIKYAPDAIAFTTAAVNSTMPNYRHYTIIGAGSSITFSLSFHIDSVAAGKYLLDNSQVIVGSKTYLSTAKNTTDRVMITKLDAMNKIYNGTFNFYAYNKTLPTDSVLVTGIYSINN